jgi:peptidoglycan/LPS O-acetylase OafA/YrhL
LGKGGYWLKAIGHTSLILFYGWIVLRASIGFQGVTGRILQHPLTIYIGRVSYGIYVFHFFAPWIIRVINPEAMSQGPFLRIILCTILTLAMAIVSWHCYERPLNRLKRLVPYSQSHHGSTR